MKNNTDPKFDIEAEPAWDISKGDNIKIAIIDAGVRDDLSELSGHIWYGTGTELGWLAGHGTNVAGIAAAVTNNSACGAGVGWNSMIMPRKGQTGAELTADLGEAARNGAHIINCSWHLDPGDPNLSTLASAVSNAFNLGAVITASMGNDGCGDFGPHPGYPAAYSNFVLACGALRKWNEGIDSLEMMYCQNVGNWIDVTAPGGDLWTVFLDGSCGPIGVPAYNTATSYSTPVISGVAALVRSANSNLSNSQVMDILKATAVTFAGWSTNDYGSGIVNAYQASLLGLAYGGKSPNSSATSNNSSRQLAKGSSKLHDVFASGGEVFYRRSLDNGATWELIKRITGANGNNSLPSIVVASDNSLHLVWQRFNSPNYQVWYSRSTNNGSNWDTPRLLINNIAVSSYQSSTYPVMAELSTTNPKQLMIVFCRTGFTGGGLNFLKSTDNGTTWPATATQIPPYSKSGLYNQYIWYASLVSNPSGYLTLTYDYRTQNPTLYSRKYDGTAWSNDVNVNASIGTTYDRHSSVAVDEFGNPIVAWCAGRPGEAEYRILYRKGTGNNTWNPTWTEFSYTTGVSDLYPALTSASKGAPYYYPTKNILYQRSNLETVLKSYDSEFGTWQSCVLSTSGQWPSISLENSYSGLPVSTWTTQASSPYEVKISNGMCLPQKAVVSSSEIRRKVVLQDEKNFSTLSVEFGEINVVTTSGDTIVIPFKDRDEKDTSPFTLENVWEYLGAESVKLPADVKWLVIDKVVRADVIEDSSGSRGENSFSDWNFSLAIEQDGTLSPGVVVDVTPSSGEISADVSAMANKTVTMKPTLTLPADFRNKLIIGLGTIIREGFRPEKQVIENESNLTANEWILSQNYPNPFNPITRISYTIPEAGMITLKVYNLFGQEVRTLVHEYQAAGSHAIDFDATGLTSGVYLYKIRAGQYSDMKKLVLIK